jgi:hypothetical protein
MDGDVAEVLESPYLHPPDVAADIFGPLVQRDNFDEKSATIWMRIWCRAVVMIAAKNGARKRKF